MYATMGNLELDLQDCRAQLAFIFLSFADF